VTPEEIRIDLSADVLFDFDKADLKPAAEDNLNNLLTVVNSRPNAAVAIEGHTDVRGDDAYNQSLSQRRAESVRAWSRPTAVISQRRAPASRAQCAGSTEADHQANRRVEIRIRN
jgi:outer membrane protein OmpA-like peptidoglycan-associated protein